jgi:hypothetical protein
MLVLSGPCRTDSVHRKPPPAATRFAARSYEPPPVREAAPVGKPLAVLLKPNPVRVCPWADCADVDDVDSVGLAVDDGLEGEDV